MDRESRIESISMIQGRTRARARPDEPSKLCDFHCFLLLLRLAMPFASALRFGAFERHLASLCLVWRIV